MALLIRRCTPGDLEAIYSVIDDASQRYRGVIPADCWEEPYMPRDELVREIEDGVEFWVIGDEDLISGVMGLQDKGDVQLIRHAYVLTGSQGRGIGSALLRHIYSLTSLPALVGTWKAAGWAIRFYEKHGFREVNPVTKDFLLNTYWDIPARQTQTSTVLADSRWFLTNT